MKAITIQTIGAHTGAISAAKAALVSAQALYETNVAAAARRFVLLGRDAIGSPADERLGAVTMRVSRRFGLVCVVEMAASGCGPPIEFPARWLADPATGLAELREAHAIGEERRARRRALAQRAAAYLETGPGDGGGAGEFDPDWRKTWGLEGASDAELIAHMDREWRGWRAAGLL